ncbi:hypothetical protein Tco_0652602 [Tanacetum coccineum]|uniref:Uncharacterized protein n=1 Tax=Tanacetum coccineum TaxID=301880 RepID=A0ABQ4WYD2_9ASTR
MFIEQIRPFYENVKQLVQKLDENIVTEVTEYMRIFDELDTEYERCVLANKNMKIERENLLLQNDCLIANSLEKDICSIVLASDIVVPPSSNCLCEELRFNCDREHSKLIELKAEILKKQQMLNESEKRSFDKQALKTKLSGKKSSGSSASEKPKVLATGMYTNSSKTKPATESRKPMPKSHTQNHRILPSKSVNVRRAAYHNRRLNVVDHNQFVIRSLKSVNNKTPQAKHSVNHTKKWKPTRRHFALYDNCPLTRIMEPIVEPLELTPSVSSSSKVTMISRSFGHTVADSITERLKRATTYVLRQIDFSLLSRTASIRESGTSVLEDLKALSWKTCQEEQTATGKEISNPLIADSLLKTIRTKSRRERSQKLQDYKQYEECWAPQFSKWQNEEKITSNSSSRDQDQVIKTSNSSSRDQDQVIKTSNSSSKDQDQVSKDMDYF